MVFTISKNTFIYEKGCNRVAATRHGAMIYNTHDTYIGKSLDVYGEWAWLEIEKTLPYATGVVLDIGANIGTHALAYSQVAMEVIAFEPQFFAFQMLCANCALNEKENITPLNMAIGNTNGTTQIYRFEPNQDINFGSISIGQGNTNVQLRTIDSLNIDDVSLMKIDVEGYEEEVLHGAVQTIQRNRPILYVESDRLDRRDSLLRYISNLDYHYEWHIMPIYNPNNYEANKENVFGKTVAFNLLCTPMELMQNG